MYRHGKGVDEEEEEGREGPVTGRSSSPTSAEIDLLVCNTNHVNYIIQLALILHNTASCS